MRCRDYFKPGIVIFLVITQSYAEDRWERYIK